MLPINSQFFAAYSHLLHQLLDFIVVDRHQPIGQVELQRLPVVAEVAQRLGQLALGKHPRGRVPFGPLTQRRPDRRRFFLTQREPLLRREVLRPTLDVVELLELRQHDARLQRVALPGVEHLATGVGGARGTLDLPVRVQRDPMIARVAVGHQLAAEVLQASSMNFRTVP